MAPLAQNRGRWGESVAIRYLRSKGLRIIHRNWRHGHGEIDIVAKDGETFVFVEVKTRSSPSLIGGYAAAAAPAKKKTLRRTVDAFIAQFGEDVPYWRFYVVEILTPPRNYAAEQIFHFECVPLDSSAIT